MRKFAICPVAFNNLLTCVRNQCISPPNVVLDTSQTVEEEHVLAAIDTFGK